MDQSKMNSDLMPGKDEWLGQFVSYTEETPVPDIFRLWAGISCLAGALERKCWMTISGKTLYPHMYIVLVGPPGSGKTFVTDEVEELWREIKELHVAPKSMSFASLGDALKDATRKIIRPGQIPPYIEFNTLLIHSRELKILMPEYSSMMLDRLTDLWDCKVWDERLRSGQTNYIIEKPQIHLLAGETPSYFTSMIPDNAWEGGFLSRTILIYAGQQRRMDLFSDASLSRENREPLVIGLKRRAQMFGKFEFTDQAVTLVRNWFLSGCEPQPEHAKLRHYISRRHIHLLKVMAVSSVSRGETMIIDDEDFGRAMSWMLYYKSQIEEIFKSAATSGDGRVIEEVWYWMYRERIRTGEPLRASIVSRFVSARVPAFHVGKVIQIMEEGGWVKKHLGGDGAFYYTPFEKQRFA